MIRCIVLDIGETLVRDDRYWASWADWFDVPRHTVSALVGAVVAQGRDNADALRLIKPGIDLAAEYAAREAAGRGEHLDETDLYDDVRPALSALRALGVRVVIAGNQTTKAAELLRALGLPADLIATSGQWGCAKPDPEFFRRVGDAAGAPPWETVYVGDHPANDTLPAATAGFRSAHLRRGPWGHLWADDIAVTAAADWIVDSLHELVDITIEENGEQQNACRHGHGTGTVYAMVRSVERGARQPSDTVPAAAPPTGLQPDSRHACNPKEISMSDAHHQVLAGVIKAVGGTWDAQRAMTAFRDAGIPAANDVARAKQARGALRRLHRDGVLVRIRQRPVEYRLAE